MKRVLVTLCAAAAGLLGASAALAQPGNYAAPPPGPAPAAQAPQMLRWGIGLRSTNLEITSNADEDSKVELEGAGIHLRYRLASSWRAELTLEGASSKDDALGFTRDSAMGTLALHYLFNPYSDWSWYALGGVGRTQTKISYDVNGDDYEEFAEGHVHLGIGLERRFDRISLGAELRGIALARDDTEGDGELYAGLDGPVPYESTAGQLNLHFTYYF